MYNFIHKFKGGANHMTDKQCGGGFGGLFGCDDSLLFFFLLLVILFCGGFPGFGFGRRC